MLRTLHLLYHFYSLSEEDMQNTKIRLLPSSQQRRSLPIFKFATPPPFSCASEQGEWFWFGPEGKDPYFPIGLVPGQSIEGMLQGQRLLSLHLRNTINYPIRLAFSFPLSFTRPFRFPGLLHPSVDPLLLSRIPMIQTLVLLNPPASWYPHLPKLSTPLKELDIYTVDPIGPSEIYPLPLNAYRSLYRLTPCRVGARTTGRILYKIPLSVPILDLSGIPIDTCIKLILQSPNVEEPYLRKPSEAHSGFNDSARRG